MIKSFHGSFNLNTPYSSTLATVNCEAEAHYECTGDDAESLSLSFSPATGTVCTVKLNDSLLEPVNIVNGSVPEGTTHRYSVALNRGSNRLVCIMTLTPLRRSQNPDGMFHKFSPVFTLFFDCAQFRPTRTANDFEAELTASLSEKIPLGARILFGKPVVRFGSKTFDEERGILHKSTGCIKKNEFTGKLSLSSALPDLLAISCALKKRFVN
jgi:hypothetical protein